MLASFPADGTVVPGIDLPDLAERSDVIVVGRVRGTRKLRPADIEVQGVVVRGNLMEAELDVERVLKGQASRAPSIFQFVEPLVPIAYGEVNRGDFGVFFLRGTPAGYEILDPYHPFVVAGPGARLTEGKLLDQIAQEVAQTLESSEVEPRNRWVRLNAVQVLEALSNPVATAALHAAAQDREAVVRVWAVSALLSRNDISALDQVANLGPFPPDPHVENLTAQLGTAMARISDKRAIPQLAHLLQSPDVNLRRGAASGLRNTLDTAAIKPLAEALNDSDREVQYQAVIGLAEITGTAGEWAPASETFEKDPKRYLDHWRAWAKANNQPK